MGPGSETSWYRSVNDYESNGGELTVRTDLISDSDAPTAAQSICAAVIGASVPPEEPTVNGLTGARVLDVNGNLIKRCLRAGSARW